MRSAWSFHTAGQLITLASIIDTMAERAIVSLERLKRDIGKAPFVGSNVP